MKRKDKGGINIIKSMGLEMTHMEEETIISICKEYKLSNADVHFRCNATIDERIDTIEGNRIYVPCVYVHNMNDKISIEEQTIII